MGLSSAIVVEMSRYDAAFSVSQELDTAPHEIQDVNTGMDLPSNTGCGINTDLTSPHKDMGSRQEWVIMAGDLSTITPSPAAREEGSNTPYVRTQTEFYDHSFMSVRRLFLLEVATRV